MGLQPRLGDHRGLRQREGTIDDPAVSVNVSPRQLMNPVLFDLVVDALMSSGLTPHRLIIEITESVFIEKISVALQTLRRLQTIGVRIALDDFGTGYSSLNFLRSFLFDRVKIDKCFADHLAPNSNANAVIPSRRHWPPIPIALQGPACRHAAIPSPA